MTEVTMLNHAGLTIREGETTLACDPWLVGRTFNDGWELVLPSAETAELEQASNIWISHEHPDHFHPPSLGLISPAVRARQTVMYQAGTDGRVLEWCRSKGFKTQELAPFEWTPLSASMRVMTGVVPYYDSWVLIEASGNRLLNMNDCDFLSRRDVNRLRSRIGPVDVLLTQFSYASWGGNPADEAMRSTMARARLLRLQEQVEVFGPRFVLPFASFVWFCSDDNQHMNDRRVTVDMAAATISECGAMPIVLAPGDRWTVGEAHDNVPALSRWRAAWDVEDHPRHAPASVAVEELQLAAHDYRKRIRSRNSRLWVSLSAAVPGVLPRLRFFVEDLDLTLRWDLRRGLDVVGRGNLRADVELRSDSLHFVFKYDWGCDTLWVNGRFRSSARTARRLRRALSLGSLNNTGRTLGPQLLLQPGLLRRAARQLLPG